MPTSRKRKGAKRYTPSIPGYIGVDPKHIERFRDEVMRFEGLTEIALRRGVCTLDDLLLMCDCINLASLIMARPKSRAWLIEDECGRAIPLMEAAIKAVGDVTKRCQATGSSVCKAGELDAIRDMAVLAGEVLKRSLDECPRLLFKEWIVMRETFGKRKFQRVRVSIKDFDRLVGEVTWKMPIMKKQ